MIGVVMNREGAKNSSGKKAGLEPVTGKCQAGRLLIAGYFCLSLLTSEVYTGHQPVCSLTQNNQPILPAFTYSYL